MTAEDRAVLEEYAVRAEQEKEAGIILDQVFILIDQELSKQQGDKAMTPELRSYVKDAVEGIALEGDAIDRATLIRNLHKKLKPVGINRPAIEEEVKKRLTILRDSDETAVLDDVESDPAAVFPGLVDIVEDDGGQPAFLIMETMEIGETHLQVCRQAQVGKKS